MSADRFPFASITALGVITIAAYGTWYYAFGVLLDPIISDTGWSEPSLTLGFALSVAMGGAGAIPAGRLLDRAGSRPVFLLAAGLGTSALWVGSTAASLGEFLVATSVGGAALFALAFYHVTQTTAVRVAPDRPARAISLLTIYGAFASAVYLPLAAFLVDGHGWRFTLRTLATTTGVVLVAGAVVVRERERPASTSEPMDIRSALALPGVRRFVAATALIGLTVGVILVYQVPLMTAAGLPLATAASFAGARGIAQLTGRVPLAPIVGRLGVRRSLVLAFAAIVAGVLLLAGSGSVWVAAAFALVAGFGIGATSPLQGIYAAELFDHAGLGASMGLLTLAFSFSGALGPAIVGQLAGSTGSRWWAILVAALAGIGATWLLHSEPASVHSTPA